MHFHVSPLNVYPDALVEVKELLGNSEATQDLKCVDILDQLAAYAESFSRARHKAKKLPSSMSDTLDREGNSWDALLDSQEFSHAFYFLAQEWICGIYRPSSKRTRRNGHYSRLVSSGDDSESYDVEWFAEMYCCGC
jgi:hypothetical protein